MHASISQDRLPGAGSAIRGTFYPSQQSRGGGSIGAVVPKLLAILVAMVVVRKVIGAKQHHGGASRWTRRRDAIAAFHRELHASDASAESAESSS